MFWHKHRWVEESRQFLPPLAGGGTKIKTYDDEDLRAFLWGQTIITLKCECGRRDQDRLLGRVDP